jgi:hypothetical protein
MKRTQTYVVLPSPFQLNMRTDEFDDVSGETDFFDYVRSESQLGELLIGELLVG